MHKENYKPAPLVRRMARAGMLHFPVVMPCMRVLCMLLCFGPTNPPLMGTAALLCPSGPVANGCWQGHAPTAH